MARTIWKFRIPPSPVPPIYCVEMPEGAVVLSVAGQSVQGDEDIYLWALVDSSAPKERRRFAVYPTGSTAPDEAAKFIGTAFLHGRSMVFHVFEVPMIAGPVKD